MPIYDLSRPFKVNSFKEWSAKLIEQKKTVKLETIGKKRTIDQNALHWLWMTAIEKETGNSKNEMHLLYRANFLAKPDDYITTIIIPDLWYKCKLKIKFFQYFKGLEDIIDIISESTTMQDKKNMAQFEDKVKRHAMDSMGIMLLTKDEKGYIDFINELSNR